MTAIMGIEWAGSLLSIAGAHFNARGAPVKAYVCWIPSSLLLIAFAVLSSHWGLCLMQAMFLYYNVSGHAFWRRRVSRVSPAAFREAIAQQG